MSIKASVGEPKLISHSTNAPAAVRDSSPLVERFKKKKPFPLICFLFPLSLFLVLLLLPKIEFEDLKTFNFVLSSVKVDLELCSCVKKKKLGWFVQ